jgi:hypothetical protein
MSAAWTFIPGRSCCGGGGTAAREDLELGSAARINSEWKKRALDLRQRDPPRYLRFVAAIRNKENFGATRKRPDIDLPFETAMGIRILEGL